MGVGDLSAAADLERRLERLTGVRQARVNHLSERARIAYDPGAITPQRIAEAINEMGYEALVPPSASEPIWPYSSRMPDREETTGRNKLIFAAVLTIPTCLLSWFPQFQFKGHELLLFVLSTPVVFIAGAAFFAKAWRAVLSNYANMDFLVALGALAAWIYSMVDIFTPISMGVHFFEVGPVVVTLVLLGRFLETRVQASTSVSVKVLMGLEDSAARRVQGDGSEVDTLAIRLKPGDRIRVRPGERIPADGIVLDGLSSIEESTLTGSPGPIDKVPGDLILAGSVNKRGGLLIEVRRVGHDTALSQIVRLVSSAQGTRVPFQQLADKVSEVFVPIVVMTAALTFFFWYVTARQGDLATAFMTGMAVLVIACPSAMALAGPTAFMAGIERAAALGMLFRGGDVLERCLSAQTVVFRRRGIVTAGQPEVTDVLPLEPWTVGDVRRTVAALARGSAHPIAGALRSAAARQSLPDVMGFEALPGRGMAGEVDDQDIIVGSRLLMQDHGIDTGPLEGAAVPLEARGRSVVFLAIDGQLAGLLGIGDEVKPSAIRAIRKLKEMRLEVVLLSGDSERTTRSLGDILGVDRVMAEVLDRPAAIDAMVDDRHVIYISDGLEDRETLEIAHVGIAIGVGSDITLKASDITMVSTDLAGIPDALLLARRTLGTIRTNLFWAFFYNSLGIPLAAGIVYPFFGWALSPMVAAGAMAASSLAVLGNSRRLKRYSPRAAT